MEFIINLWGNPITDVIVEVPGEASVNDLIEASKERMKEIIDSLTMSDFEIDEMDDEED